MPKLRHNKKHNNNKQQPKGKNDKQRKTSIKTSENFS